MQTYEIRTWNGSLIERIEAKRREAIDRARLRSRERGGREAVRLIDVEGQEVLTVSDALGPDKHWHSVRPYTDEDLASDAMDEIEDWK